MNKISITLLLCFITLQCNAAQRAVMADPSTGTIIQWQVLNLDGTFTANIISDQTGELRTQLEASISGNSDAIAALSSQGLGYFSGDSTNTAKSGFTQPYIEGPMSTRLDLYEGGVVALDLAAAGGFRVVATNENVDFSYINGEDTTGRSLSWKFSISNATEAATSLNWGSATPVTLVAYNALGAGEYGRFQLESEDNVYRYQYLGPQEEQLPPPLGGTGTDLGMAIKPVSTLYYPIPYGSPATNLNVEHSKGTAMQLWIGNDVHLAASDGRPETTNGMTWADWNLINQSGSSQDFSARSDYLPIGFGSSWPMAIPSGNILRFRTEIRGPYETNVWVIYQTNVALVASGSAPSSSLTENLLDYWNMNETSGASTVGQISGLNLTESGTAWTKNFTITGIDTTPGWSNTVSTASITNPSPSLNLGRSSASFSAAVVVAPNAITGGYGIIGEWDESIDGKSWRVRLNTDGTVTFAVTTDGSTLVQVTSTATLTAGAKNLVAVVFDNSGNQIKISINNSTFRTTTFSSDIYTGDDAVFSVGGVRESSAWFGVVGAYDQPAVWTKALSQAEVAELWKAGSILDLGTL